MSRGCVGDFIVAAVVTLLMAPIQGFAFMLATPTEIDHECA